MKCEKCKTKEASVFYREIINGSERSMALCEDCAKSEKLSDMSYFSTSDPLLLSLMGLSNTKPSTAGEVRCDLCGMSFRDFMKTGMLGCPRCYRTFQNRLSRSLGEIHGGKTHTGMSPRSKIADKADKTIDTADELARLRAELKCAIENEEYEKAAELRDVIRGKEGEK